MQNPISFHHVFTVPTNKRSYLCFVENAHLVALTWRTNDTVAQQFVTNRSALASEAQTKIEEFEAMNHHSTTE